MFNFAYYMLNFIDVIIFPILKYVIVSPENVRNALIKIRDISRIFP